MKRASQHSVTDIKHRHIKITRGTKTQVHRLKSFWGINLKTTGLNVSTCDTNSGRMSLYHITLRGVNCGFYIVSITTFNFEPSMLECLRYNTSFFFPPNNNSVLYNKNGFQFIQHNNIYLSFQEEHTNKALFNICLSRMILYSFMFSFHNIAAHSLQ